MSSIRLAITPDGRWDTDQVRLVEAVSAAGFEALGIAADRADAAAVAAYERTGLHCHEVLALLLSEDETATVATAQSLARAAETMSADWVLTIFRTPLTPDTARIIARCSSIFAEAGAGMAVEFSPLGPITSIPLALDVVDAGNRGRGRAGLMIDSWHFCFGPSTWDDLAAVPLEQIAYLQFTDALAPVSDHLFRETMNRRALPGEGVLELERFTTVLRERGYDGIVSVEVLSEELLQLPVEDVVRRIKASTEPFWG